MERDELLSQFNDLLDIYAKHKSYADKAREKADTFSSAVIEKVIADHQIKSALVADDIQPLVPQLQEALQELNASIDEAEQSKGDLGARIEELELRLAIGEISDEEFEAMSADGKDTVNDANEVIGGLADARNELDAALAKWAELSGEMIEAQPIAAEAADEDEGLDLDPIDDVSGVEVEDDFDPIVDSILPGFEDEGDDAGEGDEHNDNVDSEDVGFSVDEKLEESVDVLPIDEAADQPVEVAIDDSEVAEIGVDASEDGSVSSGEESRRAILLSNEGTPDEQIYALTGEVFTVGRGRDNDLQIKNDSKVSRFHCKVYRRGANYYLEDNKSSNGTMVNGELISERRLFGGEELVIGETFFRFRVM